MSEELLLLDDVAQSVFNMDRNQARRKASLGSLPVPAFRLGNARKGPLYVKKADLDAHLQSRYAAAKTLNIKMLKTVSV